MGNSLQEQLLKAGLVTSHKARERRTEKRKGARGAEAARADAQREAARKQQEEKAERDRALDRERTEAARRRAIAAEVRQLIEAHRVPRERGDFPYHFTDGDRVKTLNLTEGLRSRIIAGKLFVVRYKGSHELVPPEVAEKIRERNPTIVIDTPPNQESDGEDPYYSQFQVPHDLVW